MILQWSSIVRPPHTSHGPASSAGGASGSPIPREGPGIVRLFEADSRIIGHRIGRREEEDDGLLACGLAHATDELPTDPFALVLLPDREVGQVRAVAAVGGGGGDGRRGWGRWGGGGRRGARPDDLERGRGPDGRRRGRGGSGGCRGSVHRRDGPRVVRDATGPRAALRDEGDDGGGGGGGERGG